MQGTGLRSRAKSPEFLLLPLDWRRIRNWNINYAPNIKTKGLLNFSLLEPHTFDHPVAFMSFSLAKTGSVSSVWYSRSAIRKTMVGLFPFVGDKKKEQKRIAKKVFISLIHARNRMEVESEKSRVFTFASWLTQNSKLKYQLRPKYKNKRAFEF